MLWMNLTKYQHHNLHLIFKKEQKRQLKSLKDLDKRSIVSRLNVKKAHEALKIKREMKEQKKKEKEENSSDSEFEDVIYIKPKKEKKEN